MINNWIESERGEKINHKHAQHIQETPERGIEIKRLPKRSEWEGVEWERVEA